MLDFLDKVKTGDLEDGTAIGTAIVTAVNRLRSSEAKSRVLVLLTDGANNAGTVDPITAAKVAKAVGIKIYTIAAGREENARFAVDVDPRNPALRNRVEEVERLRVAGEPTLPVPLGQEKLTNPFLCADDPDLKAIAKLGGRGTRDSKLAGNPVVEINLHYTKTTDADLKEIAAFPELRKLTQK